MTTYIRNLNAVPLQEWAEKTLSPEEFAQFSIAFELNNKLWNQYLQNNIIEDPQYNYEPVQSTTYDATVLVPVKELIKVIEGHTVQTVSELDPWITRYIAENGSAISVEF